MGKIMKSRLICTDHGYRLSRDHDLATVIVRSPENLDFRGTKISTTRRQLMAGIFPVIQALPLWAP